MAIKRTKQRGQTSRQLSRTARGRNPDRPLVADEPYELTYLHKRFPNVTQRQLARALDECQGEIKTDDRQQIMNCLKWKLD